MKSKRDEIISTLAVICFLVAVGIIFYFTADPDDKRIKSYLIDKGYEVEDIEFTKVKGNLYQASEAIDIGEGELVEFWEISYYGMSSLMYVVRPKPDPEISFEKTEN